jgi:hypothetical protein
MVLFTYLKQNYTKFSIPLWYISHREGWSNRHMWTNLCYSRHYVKSSEVSLDRQWLKMESIWCVPGSCYWPSSSLFVPFYTLLTLPSWRLLYTLYTISEDCNPLLLYTQYAMFLKQGGMKHIPLTSCHLLESVLSIALAVTDSPSKFCYTKWRTLTDDNLAHTYRLHI